MGIYATTYVFNNKSCEEFGLIICSFDSKSGVQTSSAGSKIELTTSKPPYSNKWTRYNIQYSEPLEFSFQIMKIDGSEITTFDQEKINRWMVRIDDYKWLHFEQPDHDEIFFNAQVVDSKLISVGGVNLGMEFNFVTDSPYAYTSEQIKNYSVSNGNTKTFFNRSSEVGNLYPYMTVKIKSDCNFAILNSIENRKFQIDNCKAGEILTIDNENKVISSSISNRAVYDGFNYNWFRFVNTYDDNVNTLTFTGDADIEFKYRFVRKIGV